MAMKDDSKEFQIPAGDAKGHSVRKAFRMNPQMDMQIEMILGSKKFPYRTEGEFLRHAVFLHLRWIREQAEIPNSILPQIEAIVEMVRIQEGNAQFGDVIAKIVNTVEVLIKGGHKSKASELVDDVLVQVEKIKDSYWRDKYRREVIKLLGHVGTRKPRLDLHPDSYDQEEVVG